MGGIPFRRKHFSEKAIKNSIGCTSYNFPLPHLSAGKLNSRVVLHNYFSKRKDGRTAAERFFHQKPKDIFDWLLERVSWPVRPRGRKRKMEIATRHAACTLTRLKLVA